MVINFAHEKFFTSTNIEEKDISNVVDLLD